MVSTGKSDVVIASVYSEKTCLKKLMIIIIMNTLPEMTVISSHQKLTYTMKLRPRKIIVDFKFDVLYTCVFIESLQKSG